MQKPISARFWFVLCSADPAGVSHDRSVSTGKGAKREHRGSPWDAQRECVLLQWQNMYGFRGRRETLCAPGIERTAASPKRKANAQPWPNTSEQPGSMCWRREPMRPQVIVQVQTTGATIQDVGRKPSFRKRKLSSSMPGSRWPGQRKQGPRPCPWFHRGQATCSSGQTSARVLPLQESG